MFHFKTRKSMGNLHIRLEGILDDQSAVNLSAVLGDQSASCNHLFIDTDGLHGLERSGMDAFHSFLRTFPALSEKIIFKGKNGLRMALDGQRVLKVKPRQGCGCSGRCKVCKCAERKMQRDTVVGGKG